MSYFNKRCLSLLSMLLAFSTIIISQNNKNNGLATIGEEVKITYESPHPYPIITENNNSLKGDLVWTQEIAQAKSSYIAVHFQRFLLSQNDYLVVRSPDGKRRWEYTEKGNNSPKASNKGFWSIPIPGDKLIIEIYSRNSLSEYGYFIDKIATGFPEKTIINDDDSLEAVCYETTEPEAYNRSRAVARLHINGTSSGTGWLLGSEGHIMTNEHVYDAATDPTNIIVEMMAEGANCDDDCQQGFGCPGVIEAVTNTLVQLHSTLDYALLALPTNISDTYGFLQVRETPAEVSEQIYIPQHPQGWGKRIALASDFAGPVATIGSLEQPRPNTSFGYDLGYPADTQPGSSGSPVISYNDNLVIGLHHYGPYCNSCSYNRGVPIIEIVEDLGNNIPNHALACDDDYSPEFTFETSCNNGNFSVTANADLPENVGSYWGLFQTTVEGSTLTSQTIDGDPDTEIIDPILTAQWGNTATFSNLNISGHFYIKHGIWRDGCFTWIESRVALPKYEGVSAFHFENEEGQDFPSGSDFCYGQDVYINGNASEGEDRYFLNIQRRPTGSNAPYGSYANLGWTLNSTVGVINLSERIQAYDSNLYFEPGYEYQVSLAIANLGNCIGWTLQRHSIKIECCEYSLANFNSSISQNGLITATSNADISNIPDFEAETWYLVSSTTQSGGDYTFVDIQEGANYNYQAQDDDLFYFLFHQVSSDCGETCFGKLVQGGEIDQTDNDPLPCDLIECALSDYYTQSFNSSISQGGLITASHDIDFSYIINPDVENWYLFSRTQYCSGDYTFVNAQEGNTFNYQTQDDNLFYTLFHQVVSECGATCSGRLVYIGEIDQTDCDPISCDDIECALFDYYLQEFNSSISQTGLITASSDVDFSYSLNLDAETWYLVSSPNQSGGDYSFVNTQEGNTYSYQTQDDGLYYFLFHQINSDCGEHCFGEIVLGGEIDANDDDPISCDVLGCAILNSNNNSMDISILDGGESLNELTTNVQCGSEVTLTYFIVSGGAGANSDDIILEAEIPAGYTLIPGDGLTAFGAGNIVTLNNLPEVGLEITLSLEATDLLDIGTASTVNISLEASSPSGHICSTPVVTLISPEVCKGDSNGDGVITSTDLSAFFGAFGSNSGTCGIFDFNNDGVIAAADLSAFLSVFGSTCDNGTEGLMTLEESLIIARAALDKETYNQLINIIIPQNKQDLMIYPNPTNGRIFIDTKTLTESSTVRIYDALGNTLIETQLEEGIPDNRLDLSNQPSGLYLIVISDSKGETITSSKIIKD